jgi:hypothetical protein
MTWPAGPFVRRWLVYTSVFVLLFVLLDGAVYLSQGSTTHIPVMVGVLEAVIAGVGGAICAILSRWAAKRRRSN